MSIAVKGRKLKLLFRLFKQKLEMVHFENRTNRIELESKFA